MSVRPPKAYTAQNSDPLTEALEHEILGEKVATLSRLNKKLERALSRIPCVDAHADATAQNLRKRRIAEAGEALWHVTIQRELCGLLKHQAFFDEMGVPKEVRLTCGPLPLSFRRESSQVRETL